MTPLETCAIALSLIQPSLAPAFSDLAGFTYHFGREDKRVVTLKDGQGKDADEESTFTLLKQHATGDLDGDRKPDAAVLLVESGGGTGSFYYLFVLLNKDGKLVQIEQPEWLGDRSVIERVAIDRGVLSVRFITHKESDPACCPTRHVENKYRVVDGKLIGLP